MTSEGNGFTCPNILLIPRLKRSMPIDLCLDRLDHFRPINNPCSILVLLIESKQSTHVHTCHTQATNFLPPTPNPQLLTTSKTIVPQTHMTSAASLLSRAQRLRSSLFSPVSAAVRRVGRPRRRPPGSADRPVLVAHAESAARPKTV